MVTIPLFIVTVPFPLSVNMTFGDDWPEIELNKSAIVTQKIPMEYFMD